MTTFGQSCTYYISLFNFIKMFFRLIGVHILFCGKKFIPHVCLYTVRNRIFPTKQPLIPRLARKNKEGYRRTSGRRQLSKMITPRQVLPDNPTTSKNKNRPPTEVCFCFRINRKRLAYSVYRPETDQASFRESSYGIPAVEDLPFPPFLMFILPRNLPGAGNGKFFVFLPDVSLSDTGSHGAGRPSAVLS